MRILLDGVEKTVNDFLDLRLRQGGVHEEVPGLFLRLRRRNPDPGPLGRHVDAHGGDEDGRVLDAETGEVERGGGEIVGGVGEFFVAADQLAAADHVGVRVLDGDVEGERLEQDVLVGDHVLQFFQVFLGGRFERGLLRIQDAMSLANNLEFDKKWKFSKLMAKWIRLDQPWMKHGCTWSTFIPHFKRIQNSVKSKEQITIYKRIRVWKSNNINQSINQSIAQTNASINQSIQQTRHW